MFTFYTSLEWVNNFFFFFAIQQWFIFENICRLLLFHLFIQANIKGSKVWYFEKDVLGKKNLRIILTNLKITILLECICFREIWCLYLLKRSYNFNNFHFYILWQTLLNLHQLFLSSLILVCWIVFIFGILKAN